VAFDGDKAPRIANRGEGLKHASTQYGVQCIIEAERPVGDSVARNFKELQEAMSPERRARVEVRVNEALRTMALDELREARKLTQTQLASLLHVDQGSVSKMERRTDMYISTLRSYIEAMGGALHIRAVFPDGEVQIQRFGDETVGAEGEAR